tara:strand:+ start:3857 stop:4552 length:696 start_codon:yes stop_codon:yes gene_type:complete
LIKSNLILSYNKSQDKIYITTLKSANLHIRHSCGNAFQIEVHYPISDADKRKGWQEGNFWFYTFDEMFTSFKDFLKLTNTKNFEEILEKDCVIVTREPKARFNSGLAQAIFEKVMKKGLETDVINEWVITDEGLSYVKEIVKDKSLLNNPHFYPINDIYLQVQKPHHKVIDISELNDELGVEINSSSNVRKNYYTQYFNKINDEIEKLYSYWLDIYSHKEIDNYYKLTSED